MGRSRPFHGEPLTLTHCLLPSFFSMQVTFIDVKRGDYDFGFAVVLLCCSTDAEIGIYLELGIDLEEDIQVLGMLKSNPRVDQQQHGSGSNASDRTLAFQYRARYSIR